MAKKMLIRAQRANHTGLPENILVEIALLDDAAMCRANWSIFGKAGTTDVISLYYPPANAAIVPAADVLVNVERALVEGRGALRGRNWSTACELALYVAHGCDHLCGADDNFPSARRRMLARERRWVRAEAALVKALM